MTERYDDFRRPFDLEEVKPEPEPDPELERAPWETAEPYEAAEPVQDSGPEEEVWGNREVSPADRAPYAAEDAVEDYVEEEEAPFAESDDEHVVPAPEQPEPEPAPEPEAFAEPEPVPAPEPEAFTEPEPVPAPEPEAFPEPEPVVEHAPSPGLDIPDGYRTLEGEPHGDRLAVAVVVSRFNGEITNLMLKRALDELELSGVARDAVTIAAVPGAFELPLAAMALAKTRRYACVVALGCVIRGETKHFDFISSEAASGLQLAALETGTPVSFGVLTCETQAQAEARIERANDAVRSALEMADMFAKLRAAAG
jgi:6,7-dimethyl-8-ribityllumazine synthase